jgi:hypothetical protein
VPRKKRQQSEDKLPPEIPREPVWCCVCRKKVKKGYFLYYDGQQHPHWLCHRESCWKDYAEGM